MTDDDQHGDGASGGDSRWDPLPQGDYDDGATAFVKLPEGGIDALLAGDSPLAAPGHGYVPPRISVTPSPAGTDPAAPGGWEPPAEHAPWPDPGAAAGGAGADDRFTYPPAATQQWTFEEPPAPPAPGQDVTGQWSIPVAGGDLPDESGEFTTSALVEQWGGTPPPTLPGGAAAPWAAEPAGQPWEQQPAPSGPAPGHAPAHDGFRPGQGETGQAGGHPADAPDDAAPHLAPRPGTPGAVHHPAGHGAADAAPHTPPPGVPEAAEASARTAAADRAAATEARTATEARAGTGVTADAEADAANASDAGNAGPRSAADGPGKAPGRPAERARDAGAAEATGSGFEDAERDPAADAPRTPETPAGQDGDGDTAPADTPAPPHDDHPLASYVLRVNGTDRPVTGAWIGESLLYVLRERLGLAGAKDGCSQGECGACNVQVDGRLVASCLVPAVTAAGSEVRTVEGLAADGQPSDVQRALARCGAVQCGFCVPGMAMTLHDLLEGNPAPTELETRQALCGNLCRCSGYRGVLDAVKDVVAEREAYAAESEADAEEAARIPHQAGPGAGGVHPSAFDGADRSVFDRHDQPYGQDGGQA